MSKHTLISIGWLGSKRVYLDVSLEEAKRRYLEAEGDYATLEGIDIEMYEIEDQFYAYEIGQGDAPGAKEIDLS